MKRELEGREAEVKFGMRKAQVREREVGKWEQKRLGDLARWGREMEVLDATLREREKEPGLPGEGGNGAGGGVEGLKEESMR